MADESSDVSSSGSPRPPPRTDLLRERSLNSNLTFQAVLAHGPTSIPDSDDMNAALASILPENNRRRTASSPVPPAASSNGATAVEAQKEKKEGGGLLGWALQPVWMGLDALKWAGQTVNDKAVAPVVRYASPMGWASYLFDAVKVCSCSYLLLQLCFTIYHRTYKVTSCGAYSVCIGSKHHVVLTHHNFCIQSPMCFNRT
jgi:hypothetical protein